jgi:hypothetical protein
VNTRSSRGNIANSCCSAPAHSTYPRRDAMARR